MERFYADLQLSGREDLNLRPFGPESPSGPSRRCESVLNLAVLYSGRGHLLRVAEVAKKLGVAMRPCTDSARAGRCSTFAWSTRSVCGRRTWRSNVAGCVEPPADARDLLSHGLVPCLGASQRRFVRVTTSFWAQDDPLPATIACIASNGCRSRRAVTEGPRDAWRSGGGSRQSTRRSWECRRRGRRSRSWWRRCACRIARR
jgi:hypothetical protein